MIKRKKENMEHGEKNFSLSQMILDLFVIRPIYNSRETIDTGVSVSFRSQITRY